MLFVRACPYSRGGAGGLRVSVSFSRLGGQDVNTVEAIWMKSPSEVDDAQYDEFYKFIAKAYDEPLAKVSRSCQKTTHGREDVLSRERVLPVSLCCHVCMYTPYTFSMYYRLYQVQEDKRLICRCMWVFPNPN